MLLLISSGCLQIPERRTCKMIGDRWTIVAVEPSFSRLQIPERCTYKMTGDRWTIVPVEPSLFLCVCKNIVLVEILIEGISTYLFVTCSDLPYVALGALAPW